jgi:hypothetical protein
MIHPIKRLNLNYPTSRAVWNVDGSAVGSLMAVTKTEAAWGTSTIALYRSNAQDGPWFALPTAITLGPANAMSNPFDIDFAFLAAEIVADETADEYVDLTLWTGATR